MDKNTLKEYAELMKEYHLSSLEIEEDGCRVKLERHPKPPKGPKGHPGEMPSVPPFGMGAPFMDGPGRRPPQGMPPEEAGYGPDAKPEGPGAPQAAAGETITSPMVGVFYQAPAENADPYVRVGDTVRKGDILCIIEAMKLMNEITAERDGKITGILVENGAVVEYGTPLFIIE